MLANRSDYIGIIQKVVCTLSFSVITLQNQRALDIMLRDTRRRNNGHCPETKGFRLDSVTKHGFKSFCFGKEA